MAVEIIWPEIRSIPDSLVESLFVEAVDAGMIPPEKLGSKTAAAMAIALDAAGIICLNVNRQFDITKE